MTVSSLLDIGDVLITAAHTLLIAFGVPLVLLLSMLVEQQRVFNGGLLFDLSENAATFGAWVLVISNLVVELIIHWEENRLGWQEPPKYEFSLRIMAQRLAYIVGVRNGWQPAPRSPALWARVILKFITITILTLALAGSMKTAMTAAGGSNWLETLAFIVTKSSLLQLVTWIAGLLFAATFVMIAQGLSQYVAKKVIEIVSLMRPDVDDKAEKIAETMGLAAAMHLMSRLKEAKTQRQYATAFDPAVHEEVIQIKAKKPRKSPQIDKAIQWLESNPNSDLSVRDQAIAAGVSHATLLAAKKKVVSRG